MSSRDLAPEKTGHSPRSPPEKSDDHGHPRITIYSHSPILYWWPVWVVGYILALVTYLDGRQYQIGPDREWYHPSSNLGVICFATLFLVILITNVPVRGPASMIVILATVLVTVLLAYFGWWDTILGWFGGLKIHVNLGAYFWFSTLMLLVWAFTVFVVDRMSYWLVMPGQVSHVHILGASSRSYDTDNMVLEKYLDDLFRHWVLGLGSGDLHIQPFGANREEILVPNVLLVGTKMHRIRHMIATEPERFGHTIVES